MTLLLSVIVGCWYGYQQNKNSKTHLRRMAKDMEGLQKAEQALTEMQKVRWVFIRIFTKLITVEPKTATFFDTQSEKSCSMYL